MTTRQTSRSSLKTKSTKPTINLNSTKQTVPNSNQSNLLGKVDLDDEDDLLTKCQSKKHSIEFNNNKNDDDEFKSTLNKLNLNIQTMIETKWNEYKTSIHHSDDNNDDEEEENLTSRQRTSSQNSDIQSKISLIQPRQV